jgi:hypothetical protein
MNLKWRNICTKFHENPFRRSRVVVYVLTDKGTLICAPPGCERAKDIKFDWAEIV